MKRILTRISPPLLFVGLFIILMASPVLGQASSDAHMESKRTITVMGEGHATAVPDKATVRFSIVSRSDNPEAARTENASVSRDALRAVKALGVEERKMQLEALRIQPYHEYNNQTRRHEEAGFEVTRQLVVEVTDLDALPGLVSGVVEEGVNRLQGITYGLQDQAAFQDEAMVEAVKQAKRKAALMAATLGAELGDVLHITEQSFNMPVPIQPRMMTAGMAMAKSESAPEPEAYAAGEMEVKAAVQVVFTLK